MARNGCHEEGANMNTKHLSPEEQARLSPQEYRHMARKEELPADIVTSYCCEGYLQTAPFMIPKEYAFEFLSFCVRNPRGLWVAEILDPGSPSPAILATDADIRTDLSQYRVYEYGEIIDEPRNVMKYWRDDLVTFFLNCSYGFEGVLRSYQVKYRNMGCYMTNIPPVPAGRFRSDGMWVTCRAFPTTHDAVRAIEITSRLSISHGTPIHIGDPARIGIKDITKPDVCEAVMTGDNVSWDNPKPPQPNELLMCWHCGLTAEMAIKNAKLPFAIGLYPNMTFISDHLTEEFAYTEEVGSPITKI